MPIQFTQRKDGIVLAVKVVPGASRDRVVGEYDGGLKVTVSRAPEGGAANKAVVKLLADVLGIAPGNIQILRGHGSPRKQVLIGGISSQELERRLGVG